MSDEILLILKNIEERLTLIEERIDIVQANCEQMSDHVKFVEQTYDVVRCPLNFVKNRIECLMGKKNTKELPYILK